MRTAGPEFPGVLGEVGVLAEGGYPSNSNNNNNECINRRPLHEMITNYQTNIRLGLSATLKPLDGKLFLQVHTMNHVHTQTTKTLY